MYQEPHHSARAWRCHRLACGVRVYIGGHIDTNVSYNAAYVGYLHCCCGPRMNAVRRQRWLLYDFLLFTTRVINCYFLEQFSKHDCTAVVQVCTAVDGGSEEVSTATAVVHPQQDEYIYIYIPGTYIRIYFATTSSFRKPQTRYHTKDCYCCCCCSCSWCFFVLCPLLHDL